MSDSNLTIGATFDKAQLDAAIAEGQAAIAKLPDTFNLSFNEMSAVSKRALKQISDDTKAATANISEQWRATAAAAAAYTSAQQEVRAASRLVADGTIDQTAALNLLAAAKQKAAAASVALGLAEKEAAASATEDAGASTLAAAADARMQYGMAYGAARIASYAGGVGSLGYAIGGVAGRMESIAPLLADAFLVAAPIALADVVYNIANGIKQWYDNEVLLKQFNDDLMKSSEQAASAAASKNWEYIQSLIEVRRALGDDAGAVKILQDNIGNKPLKIDFDIKDDDLNHAEAAMSGIKNLVGEIRGTNHLSSAEGLIPQMASAADAAKAKIADLTAAIEKMQQEQATGGGGAGPNPYSPAKQDFSSAIAQDQAQVKALTAMVGQLNDAVNQVGSAKGTAGDELWVKQTEEVKKANDAIAANYKALLDIENIENRTAKDFERVWNEATAQYVADIHKQHDENMRAAEQEARQVVDTAKRQKQVADHLAEIQRGAAQNQIEIWEAEQAGEIALAQDRTKHLADLGLISVAERVRQEQQQEDKLYSIKLKALQEMEQLAEKAAADDPQNPQRAAQVLALQKQEIELLQQHELEKQKISESAQTKPTKTDIGQVFSRSFQGIGLSFDSMLKGVLSGTESMGQAFKRMTADIAASWASSMIEMEMKHLATELAIRVTHAATAAQMQVTDAAATITKQTQQSMDGAAEVGSNAAIAASAAFAATAAIPIVGPALAPAAAASAFSEVMAFLPQASLAVGAWDLPSDMVAQVHRGEMVVPAAPAEALRQSLTGAGSSAGDIHLHVHANDAASVEQMFRNNGRLIGQIVRQQVRQGGLR